MRVNTDSPVEGHFSLGQSLLLCEGVTAHQVASRLPESMLGLLGTENHDSAGLQAVSYMSTAHKLHVHVLEQSSKSQQLTY